MGFADQIKVLPVPMAFVIGAALAGGYYYQFYDDGKVFVDRKVKADSETTKIQAQLNETKSYLDDREKFKEELSKISEQYKAALEYLPPAFNTQDLLRKMAAEARFSGVNLVTVKPAPSEKKGFYEEIRLDIELEGSFAEIAGFISNMSKLKRIVNVQNIEINVKDVFDQVPFLQFKGALVSYRYIEGT